jgi:hypothetical protein
LQQEFSTIFFLSDALWRWLPRLSEGCTDISIGRYEFERLQTGADSISSPGIVRSELTPVENGMQTFATLKIRDVED